MSDNGMSSITVALAGSRFLPPLFSVGSAVSRWEVRNESSAKCNGNLTDRRNDYLRKQLSNSDFRYFFVGCRLVKYGTELFIQELINLFRSPAHEASFR